jgi:hypothetical protein
MRMAVYVSCQRFNCTERLVPACTAPALKDRAKFRPAFRPWYLANPTDPSEALLLGFFSVDPEAV